MRHTHHLPRALVRSLPLALILLSVASPAAMAQFIPRPVDGASTHPMRPGWGKAGAALMRLTDHDYADGMQRPAGKDRWSARRISNALCRQTSSVPSAEVITAFVWQWGQFVDHDLDLTGAAVPAEPFPIEVPLGDPWFDPLGTGTQEINLFRSDHTPFVPGVAREQMNAITAYLDASMVYGSDAVRAAALRTLDGTGRLKTSAGDLLPFNTAGLPNAPTAGDPTLFLAGDVRANEQNGLTALHTLFVREHNTLCGIVAKRYPHLDGEGIYQAARALVGAEIQRITYAEWLPVLLGPAAYAALGPYTGWKLRTEPSIANEFSTGAFRFGHTMLSSTLLRLDASGQPIAAGNLALRDAFFNPGEITAHGIDPLLRGLATQRPEEVDVYIIDDVRNFLFGPPGSGGFDLASLNIQRGRDHGLCSYNLMREGYGLPKVTSFFPQVTSIPGLAQQLSIVYGHPDDTDVWIGCLAEDHLPGAIVGELVAAVLVDQFGRIRDGDFHWYQRMLPAGWIAWVDQQSLADIVRRNTPIAGELQDDVFRP